MYGILFSNSKIIESVTSIVSYNRVSAILSYYQFSWMPKGNMVKYTMASQKISEGLCRKMLANNFENVLLNFDSVRLMPIYTTLEIKWNRWMNVLELILHIKIYRTTERNFLKCFTIVCVLKNTWTNMKNCQNFHYLDEFELQSA